MKILIVEDDLTVSDFIEKGLKEGGHVVDKAIDGKDGLFLSTTEEYDVIVMDRMLPEIDGLSIIKMMRAAGKNTPVLVLSALADVDERVEGLKSGADDYLVKPFAFSELIARVEILNGRSKAKEASSSFLVIDDLKIDKLKREVYRGNVLIDLQPREFKLLEYLMENENSVVTRTMLLENVWNYHFEPQTNIIDVHMSRLRNKINSGFDTKLIRTIRGAGYIIK